MAEFNPRNVNGYSFQELMSFLDIGVVSSEDLRRHYLNYEMYLRKCGDDAIHAFEAEVKIDEIKERLQQLGFINHMRNIGHLQYEVQYDDESRDLCKEYYVMACTDKERHGAFDFIK